MRCLLGAHAHTTPLRSAPDPFSRALKLHTRKLFSVFSSTQDFAAAKKLARQESLICCADGDAGETWRISAFDDLVHGPSSSPPPLSVSKAPEPQRPAATAARCRHSGSHSHRRRSGRQSESHLRPANADRSRSRSSNALEVRTHLFEWPSRPRHSDGQNQLLA